MKSTDTLTMKLRNICQDLEIAVDHLDAVLPEVYQEYRKEFCVYNILYGYRDTLMEIFMVIGEEIIKRRIEDGKN